MKRGLEKSASAFRWSALKLKPQILANLAPIIRPEQQTPNIGEFGAYKQT